MNKKRLALFFGGRSSEYEVSLKSGEAVFAVLDTHKYAITKVHIGRDGLWSIDGKKSQDCFRALLELKKRAIDCAVILPMHGEWGENGRLQALLEWANIRYTGSGIAASAIGMDKVLSAALFRQSRLAVPRFFAIERDEILENKKNITARVKKDLGYPCVIKPTRLGSSVGVSIVKNESELHAAIGRAFDTSDSVMLSKYIEGIEVTCGVVEQADGTLTALIPTEISLPQSEFFDYKAKYKSGVADEITPARLTKSMLKKVQDIALIAHRAIGCRGISRTDMIIERRQGNSDKRQGNTRKIFVLEINTLPGMTAMSLVPQGAAAAGITFIKLVDTIIRTALKL